MPLTFLERTTGVESASCCQGGRFGVSMGPPCAPAALIRSLYVDPPSGFSSTEANSGKVMWRYGIRRLSSSQGSMTPGAVGRGAK